ncbi:MAG: hypothetical protein HGGPFJEG_00166 [Ignavibacteria bacterium]|nr:hypothetical protein [Ignavibacteria bacterium]
MKEGKSKYDFIKNKTCPYCQSKIKAGADFIVCSSCGTPHHRECWDENKGCTTYGCSENPNTEKSISLQAEDVGNLTPEQIARSLNETIEKKFIKCPNCNNEIEDKSVYCRFCGYNLKEKRFDEAKKEFEKEFKKRYKEKADFSRRRFLMTLVSIVFVTAAVGYLTYLSYSKLDEYFSSDDYRIRSTVENWQKAWQDKDTEKMKTYLTDDYKFYGKNGKSADSEERLKKLESTFKSQNDMELKFSRFRIISDSTTDENDRKVQFEQSYKSGKFTENGLKTLRVYKGEETNGDWKIYREILD